MLSRDLGSTDVQIGSAIALIHEALGKGSSRCRRGKRYLLRRSGVSINDAASEGFIPFGNSHRACEPILRDERDGYG
jgi:hypothetical protein